MVHQKYFCRCYLGGHVGLYSGYCCKAPTIEEATRRVLPDSWVFSYTVFHVLLKDFRYVYWLIVLTVRIERSSVGKVSCDRICSSDLSSPLNIDICLHFFIVTLVILRNCWLSLLGVLVGQGCMRVFIGISVRAYVNVNVSVIIS